MLRLYMDVHVPAPITESLRRRGIDVLTSQEDGTRTAADESLLQRATALGRILISQDLLDLAAQWQASSLEFSGLVFAPQEGGSMGVYVEDLELIAACCSDEELRNAVYYLPLA